MPSLALACRLSAPSMALRRASSPPQFLPSSLFGASDQGYWYDNQDLSTMFQDTAGTVPVTAVEQPVGLQLDKSGKGNRRITPGPTTSRPILRQDANGIYYLDTDGVDDWMRTAATVDFSGSDKITLVQGLHKRNDTAAIFNELSTNANIGSAFFVVSGLNASYGRYSSVGTGSYTGGLSGNVAYFSAALHTAPDTAILSATHDIAGDLSRIWRNGIAGIDGTADKGTGNFGNDYVYFYARSGLSSRFNGRDYGQFAISRLLSDEDRAKVQNVFNVAMGGIY